MTPCMSFTEVPAQDAAGQGGQVPAGYRDASPGSQGVPLRTDMAGCNGEVCVL